MNGSGPIRPNQFQHNPPLHPALPATTSGRSYSTPRFGRSLLLQTTVRTFASGALNTGVSVQTRLADGLPFIHGDRVQLQQVILNLIINAVEAMSGVAEAPRELLITTGLAGSSGVVVSVEIPDRDWRRRLSSTSSRPSTRPSPPAWGWVYRFAAPSWKRMGDDCGRRRTNREVPSFSSSCLSISVEKFPGNSVQKFPLCQRCS
jgi:hypothetical protein